MSDQPIPRNDALVHDTARVHFANSRYAGDIVVGAHAVVDEFVFLYAPKNHVIDIGRHVHVAVGSVMSGGTVKLEDYSNVGSGCRLLCASDDFTGPYLIGAGVPAEHRNVRRAAVTLQKFATLGALCVVMPGVTIGEGARVGACSFVTKDVPPWTIWAGTPARQIGEVSEASRLAIIERALRIEAEES